MSRHGVSIKGISYSLPEKVVSNDDKIFSNIPELPDNWWWFWGINSRNLIDNDESELSLASDACTKAMQAASIGTDEIELVLSNTTNFYLTTLDDEEAVQNCRRRIYPRLSISLKNAL
jgi:3-oxoacyl-[acyl-carrier-protein] synthase III